MRNYGSEVRSLITPLQIATSSPPKSYFQRNPMSSSLPPWHQAIYTQIGYTANQDIDTPSSTPQQPESFSPPSTSTLTTPKTPKRRRAITDAERKALRTYAASSPNGKPRHQDLSRWFESQYAHRLSQSTISTILGPKFAYLDTSTSIRPSKKKNRACQWPDLELALFHWQQGMMHMEAPVTIEQLKKMAARFWESMDQYAGLEAPKFSDGWVEGYKARHPMKKRVEHGDALQAVKTLRAHARQQELGDQRKGEVDGLLRALHGYEGVLNGLMVEGQQQQIQQEGQRQQQQQQQQQQHSDGFLM